MPSIKQLLSLALLLPVVGCTSQPSNNLPVKEAVDNSVIITNDARAGHRNPEPLTPDIYPAGATPTEEPILRYGRYNLASAKPTSEQQDLMAQIITTNVPGNLNPIVRDAMDYVMMRSGYSLCPASSSKEVKILYSRSLPAAHYKLGPITLRNALQVLAGPAFQVEVDEVNRSVCFAIREDYKLLPTMLVKAKTKPTVTQSLPVKATFVAPVVKSGKGATIK